MSQLAELSASHNHFELFALPVQYQLDRQLLHSQYLKLTHLTHPDAVGGDDHVQLEAMQLSARVNEAFATLDDDFRRAEYLLTLREGATDPEPRLPADLLDRIFELRETLTHDSTSARQVREEAGKWLARVLAQCGEAIDAGKLAEARQLLETARYVRRVTQS